jgi:hypothetical protein
MDDLNFLGSGYILVVGLIVVLIFVLSLWQIFHKAGEAGWKSIVPIYNTYILLKIVKLPVWYLVLLFVPVANVIVSWLIAFALAKVFGKSAVFALVGLILFPYFGYMLLGWGSAEYKKAA